MPLFVLALVLGSTGVGLFLNGNHIDTVLVGVVLMVGAVVSLVAAVFKTSKTPLE